MHNVEMLAWWCRVPSYGLVGCVLHKNCTGYVFCCCLHRDMGYSSNVLFLFSFTPIQQNDFNDFPDFWATLLVSSDSSYTVAFGCSTCFATHFFYAVETFPYIRNVRHNVFLTRIPKPLPQAKYSRDHGSNEDHLCTHTRARATTTYVALLCIS